MFRYIPLLFVALGFRILDAQCPSNPSRENSIALPVRAVTKQLKPVEGLQLGNFAVTLNGIPQDICAVTHTRSPISVGILFDTSGSMNGIHSDILRPSASAVQQLLDASGPGDEYFLQYVSEKPAAAEFTADVSRIRAALAVKAKGKTALLDSIYLALATMRKARNANRVLVIFSDGIDNRSSHKLADLEVEYRKMPIPIFFIALIEGMPMSPSTQPLGSPDEMAIRESLVKFVNRSGGYSTPARGSRHMSDAVESLVSTINSPYVLLLPSSLIISPTTELRVNIINDPARPLALFRSIQFTRAAGLSQP